MKLRLLQFKQPPNAPHRQPRQSTTPTNTRIARQIAQSHTAQRKMMEDFELIRNEVYTEEVGVQVTAP